MELKEDHLHLIPRESMIYIRIYMSQTQSYIYIMETSQIFHQS